MIVCEFHLFDLHQKIILVDNTGAKCIGVSGMDDLGTNIADLCNEYHESKVHLIGNSNFANENIIPNIYTISQTKYNNNDISVEVN